MTVPPAGPSAGADPAPPAEARPEEARLAGPKPAGARPDEAADPDEKVADIAQKPDDEPAGATPSDSTGWRSYAALVITGLGVPLAYWGRSGFPIRACGQGQSAGSGAIDRNRFPAGSGE